ncbi:MAG TPA: NAD-dependent epimerase/dehydratase family protein [Bryobacteraceae bacterium]|jgi:predicted dehydrogenase/nucleoside-diphosphate-sugar epimerase|nr:NAD-dependent epimerase/dehydratase family protein [Bryobacteraceae bacterium]
MQQTIRVCLVGAGYVASRHLAALRDLPFVNVVGICDVDRKKAEDLAARFKIPGVFSSLSEMAGASPQVVHILTPPSSHCALTLEALDMGCHVFVEKPMAETAEECDRMMARAREKRLILSVNHSMRFEPAVVAALDHVAKGHCGDILSAYYFRGSDYPPYPGGPRSAVYRQGSYPFRDLGVHAVYLLEAFLGPIEKLSERHYGTGRDPMLTFDEWRASVEAQHGTGEILLSWNMHPLQNDLWVHGTRGILHVDAFLQRCHLHRTYPGPKQLHFIVNGLRHAMASLKEIPSFVIRAATGKLKPSPGIYASVVAFHQALAAGAPAPVSPEEGRRAVALVAEASRAADEEKDRIEAARREELPAPARILVTGAAGFLGSALTRRLRELGEAPRVFLRRQAAAGSAADGLDAVYGSLGEPDAVDRAVAGVEVVYHVGAAMKGWREDFEAGTIWGTRNIIEACLKHGVRLVYVSSLGVLDHAGHVDGVTVNEMSPVEPHPRLRGLYSQTKLEAEQMVLAAIAERGLKAVVVRPGQIFGPGAEQVTPNGVIKVAGKWILAGSGQRPLPLVYRDDVVDALLLAAESGPALGHIVNVVDTIAVTQNEYLRYQLPAVGAKVWKVPVSFLLFAGAGVEMLGKALKRDVPLSRYKIRALKPLSRIDPANVEKLLGWKPKVGVKEGLVRTFLPK